MFVTNIKIFHNNFNKIKNELILKLDPNYNIKMNKTEIYYLENFSFMNWNSYLTVITFSYIKDYIGISIVSGGANRYFLFNFDWSTEKSSNNKIKDIIFDYCNLNRIKYEILDNERIN